MGDFDSDTSALIERAALNASRTEHDLEAWIFGHLGLTDGMRIADLGCGTGKQLFALAERVSPDTELIGIDISAAAVAEVNDRASRGGRANVRALRASLDECPEALPDGRFDLLLSTYAVYYARDLPRLLERLREVLSPGGSMFLCGPGVGTNGEMITLVNGVQDALGEEPVAPVEDFLDSGQIAALGRIYGSVSVSRMENAVSFASVAEVMTWWRNHNMFRPAAEQRVMQELEAIFVKGSGFRLTKHVLGVHARA